MRITFLSILTFTFAVSAPVLAQVQPQSPVRRTETVTLTVDEAVQLAIDHNVDLAAARLDPQIGDTRVAAAAGAFKPAISSNVQRNNQLLPASSFLTPTATRT